MSATSPFMILRKPSIDAVAWSVSKLERAGFRTMRTFDLQAARSAHLDCPCPHHGNAQCDCQMVVLLVYKGDSHPATMVIHGNDEMSWFYLIDNPQQPIGPTEEKNIQEALSPELNTKA